MFLISRGELAGRLDAYFNWAIKNISLNSQFQTEPLYKLVRSFSGGTPSKANPNYWNGSIPWASPKDFGNLYLEDTEDHISDEALADSSTKLAPQGAVLVVVRSGILQHTLPITVTKCPIAINQDIKALVSYGDVLSEFLAIYFTIYQDALLPLIVKHSTTVQSINSEQFFQIRIPIPPFEVQHKIIDLINHATSRSLQMQQDTAVLLSSIDDYLLDQLGITLPPEPEDTVENRMFFVGASGVRNGRFDPSFYQPRFAKVLQEIESATHHPLHKLATFSSETWDQKSLYDDIFPYIEISEIDTNTGDIHNISFVPKSEAPSRAKMIVRNGDIIISTTRPNRGAIAKIDEEYDLHIASTGLAVIRSINQNLVKRDYLFQILRHKLSLLQMEQRSSGGNYPAITQYFGFP